MDECVFLFSVYFLTKKFKSIILILKTNKKTKTKQNKQKKSTTNNTAGKT